MIICHKYKFIFLKTNKTAGTSIEIALSKFCGPDDVITPLGDEDDAIRKKLGYRGPQNYLLPLSNYNVYELAIRLLKGKKKKFYDHIVAKKIRAYIGKKIWNSYYKFCVERNPWDRCVSQYYWVNRKEPETTISEHVDSKIFRLKKKGYGLYTIDGKIVVDKLCKYENLTEDLEAFRKHVGIPEPLELPHTKSKYRKKKEHYREVLTDDDRKKIADLFREEIEMLGYEW